MTTNDSTHAAGSSRRHIAVLTTGRQDYGILRSTIAILGNAPDFRLSVWAGGMHLRERFGTPLEALREDDVPVARTLDFLAEPPEPVADAARAMELVGRALVEETPDALVLVGDRSETVAAGIAATMLRTPIVHYHGGEESEGAIDNVFRHALTKLSHLHLVTHEAHAARVLQMGEDPDTVVVVGAPGVDNYYRSDLLTLPELSARVGHALTQPLVLVTVHPATLGEGELDEVTAVAAALERIEGTVLITQPNADHGGAAIRAFWTQWAQGRSNVVLVDALGARGYWSALRAASVVVGNSSSGIIEAPAVGLPVVNVGSRQKGRLRHGDIADVEADAGAVERAVRAALAAAPGAGAGSYLPGPAAPRILAALRRWKPVMPPRKAFVGWPNAASSAPAGARS